ncbi:TonB family protein [Hydrocarboniphaga sp.]|uniref:energy transducer TonB n=1 Tax=Hydrocarboniphaga sp. TaxID=2033016 RepID=UPI003D105F26
MSLPLSHPQRVPATNPKLASRVGIAIAVLLHALVLAVAMLQITPAPLKLPEPPAMLTVFSIPAELVSAQINVAAPAPPALEKPVEKPVVKPKPKPKPRPVEKPVIAAAKPTPAPPVAVAEPTPAPAEPVVTAAAPPPQAITSPNSTAAVTSAPTAMQGIASPRPTLSPAETDRLARQYAGVVSRMISSSQKWPLMSKQMGETGIAMVRLKIARDGRVVDAQLLRATGYARLDEEARAVVLRIGRFMPVPSRLRPNDEFLLLDQPMRFGPA